MIMLHIFLVICNQSYQLHHGWCVKKVFLRSENVGSSLAQYTHDPRWPCSLCTFFPPSVPICPLAFCKILIFCYLASSQIPSVTSERRIKRYPGRTFTSQLRNERWSFFFLLKCSRRFGDSRRTGEAFIRKRSMCCTERPSGDELVPQSARPFPFCLVHGRPVSFFYRTDDDDRVRTHFMWTFFHFSSTVCIFVSSKKKRLIMNALN